jgi:hypothetical protein
MIKRRYFASVKKSFNDESMSYSFMHVSCDLRSWFADPSKVLTQILADIEWPDYATGGVEVIAFNRI